MRTRSNVYLYLWENQSKEGWLWDFPGGSVVKTQHFHYRVHGFQFSLETKILHASKCGQKKKKKKKRLGKHYRIPQGVLTLTHSAPIPYWYCPLIGPNRKSESKGVYGCNSCRSTSWATGWGSLEKAESGNKMLSTATNPNKSGGSLTYL